MEWELHIFDNNRLCCFVFYWEECFVFLFPFAKLLSKLSTPSIYILTMSQPLWKETLTKCCVSSPIATALFIVDLMSVNDSSHPRWCHNVLLNFSPTGVKRQWHMFLLTVQTSYTVVDIIVIGVVYIHFLHFPLDGTTAGYHRYVWLVVQNGRHANCMIGWIRWLDTAFRQILGDLLSATNKNIIVTLGKCLQPYCGR